MSLERITVSSAGQEGNAESNQQPGAISADGRWTVFDSLASNLDLTVSDTNGASDVFLRDNFKGTTRAISIQALGGATGSGVSRYPSISGNGEYVSFYSSASNLLPSGDTNNTEDIFVCAVGSGITVRVSKDDAGVQGNGPCSVSYLSATGRFVVFESRASNLDPAFHPVGVQVYVHDRDLDGNFVFDEPGQTRTRLISFDASRILSERAENPTISDDGRLVAFEGRWIPGNPDLNCYIHDRDTDVDGVFDEIGAVSTVTISTAPQGTDGNASSDRPRLSADRRWIVFRSLASDLVSADGNGDWDVFVRDVSAFPTLGATQRVSLDFSGQEAPSTGVSNQSISLDGRYVVFDTNAALVPSDSNGVHDVYLLDRDWDGYRVPNGVFDEPGRTLLTRVSALRVRQGDAASFLPSVSADGLTVSFLSSASQLVSGDNNGVIDIFLSHRLRILAR